MKGYLSIGILLTYFLSIILVNTYAQELPPLPPLETGSIPENLPPLEPLPANAGFQQDQLPPLPQANTTLPPLPPADINTPEQYAPGVEPYPTEPYPAEPYPAQPGFTAATEPTTTPYPAPAYGAPPMLPTAPTEGPFEREPPAMQPLPEPPKPYVPPKKRKKSIGLKEKRTLSVKGNTKNKKELFKKAISLYKTIQKALNEIDDITAQIHENFRQLDDKLDQFNTKTNISLGTLDSILEEVKAYLTDNAQTPNKTISILGENVQTYELDLKTLRQEIEKLANTKMNLIQQTEETDQIRNDAAKKEVEAGSLKRKILITPDDSEAQNVFTSIKSLSSDITNAKTSIISQETKISQSITDLSNNMSSIESKTNALKAQVQVLKKEIDEIKAEKEKTAGKAEEKVITHIQTRLSDIQKRPIKDQLTWYEQVLVTTAHGMDKIHNVLKLNKVKEMKQQTVGQVINTLWNSFITLLMRPFNAIFQYITRLTQREKIIEEPVETVKIAIEQVEEKIPERAKPEITQIDMNIPLAPKPTESMPPEAMPTEEMSTEEMSTEEMPMDVPPELAGVPENISPQDFPPVAEMPPKVPPAAMPPESLPPAELPPEALPPELASPTTPPATEQPATPPEIPHGFPSAPPTEQLATTPPL